ncbi:MAG: beta-lactamase family protein [Actinomycetota bacterium]|nr:beta-lactamase family protein [Actinomycetota bacterium]
MSDDRPGLEPSTGRALTHRLRVEQATSRLPSVAAGLVRGGRLVWSDAVGTADGREGGAPADSDTQYRMGSITKTFVAVLVLRLRDAGSLDLDDRFEEHVPGSAFGRATVAQLLSHSSGLQAETDGPWWERTPGGGWDDLVSSTAPVQHTRAGRRFHYSNVGYGALGELVARAHGMPWHEVVARDLLAPLDMRRTTPRPSGKAAQGLAVHPLTDQLLLEPEHDAGMMAPAGQLWSTVDDLARWAAFLGGDLGDILSRDTMDEMLEPHVVNDLPGVPWTAAHGLGWQVWNVEGRRYAGHGGSMPGFLAGLQVDLESGDGVVSFANTTSGMSPFALHLLQLVADREPLDPPVWRAGGSSSEAVELVGAWHWGPKRQQLRADGERGLVLGEPGEGRGSRFRLVGPDHWVGLDGYYAAEQLRVVRDVEGAVSHLDLASFRLTREPYDADRDIPGGVDESGWH